MSLLRGPRAKPGDQPEGKSLSLSRGLPDQRVYTYGLNGISQSQASGTNFYGYDGHGRVRVLTDADGAVTDRYYDEAFGNVIGRTGTTQNDYWDSGARLDSESQLH